MNHGSFVNDQIVKCLVLMTELYFILNACIIQYQTLSTIFFLFFSHVKLPSVFYQFIVGN